MPRLGEVVHVKFPGNTKFLPGVISYIYETVFYY